MTRSLWIVSWNRLPRDEYRMQTLITGIVTSYPFLNRHIPNPTHHPCQLTFLSDRRTCLKGLGAALSLPLLETMGWAEPGGQGRQAAGASRLHVHAARRDHGAVLAPIAGDFPYRAAARSGIAAARARPVPHGEGDLRGARSLRSTARRTRWNCPPGSPRRCRMRTTRNRINIAISADQIAANYVGGLPPCRRSNWRRCRRRTRRTRKA